jgi:type IV secretory pathway VirB9-like protein
MVIERTGKRFRLRKGKTVVCLWNEGPQQHTAASTSGATERGASRELKEPQQ